MNITFSMLKNFSSIIILLIWSTIIGISSSSWVIAWICLEINTLAICWLIANDSNKWNNNENNTFLYYIIQVAASIIILVSACQENNILVSFLMILALLTKIGTWPLHNWYINLIQSIEIKYNSILTVISWQNIIPLVIIISINENIITLTIAVALSVASVIVPISNLTSNLSLNSIIAISSFNNNGWILIASTISLFTLIGFLSLYTATLIVTLKSLNEITSNSINIIISFWTATLVVSNIGGLPPLTIFWANVIIINSILLSSLPSEICLVIVLAACYLLYHYLWISLNEISYNPFKSQLPNNFSQLNSLIVIIIVSSVSATLLIVTLGLT